MRHLLENPKNICNCPAIIARNCIKKALEIPQNALRKPKQKQVHQVLPFISIFKPNNPPKFNIIKTSIDVFKRNNVPAFENIELIHSKRQTLPTLTNYGLKWNLAIRSNRQKMPRMTLRILQIIVVIERIYILKCK